MNTTVGSILTEETVLLPQGCPNCCLPKGDLDMAVRDFHSCSLQWERLQTIKLRNTTWSLALYKVNWSNTWKFDLYEV